MTEKIDTKVMKKIAHEIIKSELNKYNSEINIKPLTMIEYYNNYILKNNVKLQKKAFLSFLPLVARGFNDPENGDTVIFLQSMNKIKRIDKKIFVLVEACYHEIRHNIQQKFNKYSYKGFLFDIDFFLRKTESVYKYFMNHSNYSFEIGANLYGLRKAKDYLMEKYPSLYKLHEKEIEEIEKMYNFDYMTYDACDNINHAIQLYRELPESSLILAEDISPTLEIFIDDEKNFKSVEEILEHEKFKNLDLKIVYAFLSCESFLEETFAHELTDREAKILKESLIYTKTIYENQINYIEKNVKDDTSFIYKKNLMYKINNINHYLLLLAKRTFRNTKTAKNIK